MERMTEAPDNTISTVGRRAVATQLECDPAQLQVKAVDGGYSRNRRALVGCGNTWLFAKEVDRDALPGDGDEEVGWLRKDHGCTQSLRRAVPELVPEWSSLVADDHLLLMTSYRADDGWQWTLPENEDNQSAYVQAVVDATKKLESLSFDDETVEQLNLKPHFRDALAFDAGCELLRTDEAVRQRLTDIYGAMGQDESLGHMKPAADAMNRLLDDDRALEQLEACARRLGDQPNDSFGHCDVRSDNIAYHQATGQTRFVDWNWASMIPKGFGATEFLIDMSRRGVDTTPWLKDANLELLAASVGFFAVRSLKDPLTPGSTLRQMQAEAAAVAFEMYEQAVRAG